MSEQKTPPEDAPVLFIDRCLGSKIVPEVLRDAGVDIRIHDELFEQNELDNNWLPVVGAKGWAVLTEDGHIRTRAPEIKALIEANTHVFILRYDRRMSQADKAQAILKAIPEIQQIIKRREAPICAGISPAGKVDEIQGWDDLIESYRKRTKR